MQGCGCVFTYIHLLLCAYVLCFSSNESVIHVLSQDVVPEPRLVVLDVTEQREKMRVVVRIEEVVSDDLDDVLQVSMEHSLVQSSSMMVFVCTGHDELFIAGVHHEHTLVAVSCEHDGVCNDIAHELVPLFNRYNEQLNQLRYMVAEGFKMSYRDDPLFVLKSNEDFLLTRKKLEEALADFLERWTDCVEPVEGAIIELVD